jgi:hypothetical protein
MKRPEIFLRYNPTAMIQHPDRFSHFEKRCREWEMRTSYNVPKLFQSTTELPENENLVKIMPQSTHFATSNRCR